jgi:hypothetical protein
MVESRREDVQLTNSSKAVLIAYALLISGACVLWVPRRLEAPGETKRMTARYAPLWDIQKPPKDFVLYKRYDSMIGELADAFLDSSKKQSPETQANLEKEVQDVREEYPEFKNRNESPQQPNDYVDPDMYRYASVDFGWLGLEFVALSALCGACLIIARKTH